MIDSPKSCAVAFPSQRNNATPKNAAILSATDDVEITRKPPSILALRTQLLAQQQRNLAATVHATKHPKVAHEVAHENASCAVAFPSQRNNATSLIVEFMEVDGMTLEAATELAALCQPPRPASEWAALIDELDELIEQACKRDGLDPEACQRIRAARRQQSLASIPTTLHWYRTDLQQCLSTQPKAQND